MYASGLLWLKETKRDGGLGGSLGSEAKMSEVGCGEGPRGR